MDTREESSRFGLIPAATSRNLSSSSSAFFSANQSPFFSPRSPVGQLSESTRSEVPSDDFRLFPDVNISSSAQKIDHVYSSTGISNSNLSSYSYGDDDRYTNQKKKQKLTLRRRYENSFTPNSTSFSSNRVRNCDVYIGYHGRKSSLLRFADWLRAELEIQGITCFSTDRAKSRNSRKHGIMEKAMDVSAFGVVILTKKIFQKSIYH